MNKTDVLIRFEKMLDMGNTYAVKSPWGDALMSRQSLVAYFLLRLSGQISKDNKVSKAEYVYEINVTDNQEEDYWWVRIGRLDGLYFYHSANGYKLSGLDADRFLLFLSQDMECGLRIAVERANAGVIQVGKLQM